MLNSGVGNVKQFSPPNCPQPFLPQKNSLILSKHEVLDLKSSLNRLELFIEGLGKVKDSILVDCVTSLYNSDELQSLTSEKVMKAAQVRVEKIIKNRKLKKNWSGPDILLLVWILAKYIETHEFGTPEDLTTEDWNKIADLIPGSTGDSCLFRWLNLHKNRLSFNQWSHEQSSLLQKIVKEKGTENWKEASETLYKDNKDKNKVFRTAKQCRQHWACYLNPVLKKGPWQEEEDIKLVREIISHKGAKKWSIIAKKFNGRTENALKNRYNLLIEREIKLSSADNNEAENYMHYLKKFLQERCISSFDQSDDLRPINIDNKLAALSSKTLLEESLSNDLKNNQMQLSPSVLSAFIPYQSGSKEKKVKQKIREDVIPYSKERISLLSYFFQQGHHK